MGLEQYTESVCACEKCVHACRRPCWPTPAEAKALIDAGHGDKLMADYWHGSTKTEKPVPGDPDVFILSPANPGYEGQLAPAFSIFDLLLSVTGGGHELGSGCVFHVNGLCALHDAGLKPIEGRLALLCAPAQDGEGGDSMHHEIAKLWETDEGRAVVAEWKTGRGI